MVGKPSGLDLTGDEKVIWSGRRSMKTFLGPLFVGILMILVGIVIYSGVLPLPFDIPGDISLYVFLGLLGLGLIILLSIYVKRLTSIYAITNEKVYSRFGFISRDINSAMLENITDNELSQSIIGRIFDYGTVKFNTAGSSNVEIIFKGVSNPHDRISKVYSLIDEAE